MDALSGYEMSPAPPVPRRQRRRLTPEEAMLRRLGPEPIDDGHPDYRDGQFEEDVAPPTFGWHYESEDSEV